MLKHIEHIEKSFSHVGFSKVSLSQANADWLAITLLKNVLQPHVRQRMVLDLVREGALQDSVARSNARGAFFDSFVALNLAVVGNQDRRFDLFKTCIQLISVFEGELVTADQMSEMERVIAREFSNKAFVGTLPRKYKTSELWFDMKHDCNLNRPIKRKGVFYKDLRQVFLQKNTNRLQVLMTVNALRPHITTCYINLPVHFHTNEQYVETHLIPLLTTECEVRTKLPSIQRVPCAIGTLPIFEWPEFCKTMNVARRNVDGLYIISVFLFYFLWNPRTRDRLQALVDMISSPEQNEVTETIADVMSHYVIDDKTTTKVRNKTNELMIRFADAILLSNKLPFEINVQYVSSTTLASSKE